MQFGLYPPSCRFRTARFAAVRVRDLEDAWAAGRFDLRCSRSTLGGSGGIGLICSMQSVRFCKRRTLPGDTDKPKSVAVLFYHLPTGTNVTHFFTLNKAIMLFPPLWPRGLSAPSLRSWHRGRGYSPSINGTPPWYVLALGANLFETILLNCCVEGRRVGS